MSGRRAGFTLIEVVVALLVAGLAVLTAHRTFTVASDLARRVSDRREARDRAMNARRFLTAAFGSLDVGGEPPVGFAGSARGTRFTTWLWTADGRLIRELVTIAAENPERAAPRLVAVVSAPDGAGRPDTLLLVREVTSLTLDYLLDFGAASPWAAEWRSALSAPLAVRLRIGRSEPAGVVDTLFFAIGPRG